jgi:D-alanine-D-alanine ligase
LTIKFPLFAKPNAEGSSKGIAATSRVANFDELLSVCRELLLQYDSGVLVEQFLPGREFTVGILGTGREARCLGTMEILLSDQAEAEIYSYHNKENYEELVSYRHCHSAHDWFAQRAEMVALKAWQVLGCRDGGRVDIRFDDSDSAQFLEANPLAGLHPWHSDLPMIATAQGVQYVELIRRIVDSATSRCVRSFRRSPVPLGPASVYGLAHLTSYEGQQL